MRFFLPEGIECDEWSLEFQSCNLVEEGRWQLGYQDHQGFLWVHCLKLLGSFEALPSVSEWIGEPEARRRTPTSLYYRACLIAIHSVILLVFVL